MKKTFFLTGATGFVGSYLLKVLLEHGHSVYALARGSGAKTASDRVRHVLEFWGAESLHNNVIILEGDMVSHDLGLDAPAMAALCKNIDEIFHAAAITDINRPKAEINKVNVEGTSYLLELARRLSVEGKLVKTNHISTAFIYGDYQGVFKENSLDLGQKFSNTYEESKFQAELLVQEYRDKGLWIDVFRPPLVIGDSRTGRTFQFKHIYQFINLCKLELFDVLPILGMYASVATIDTLCEAVYWLSQSEQVRNSNYHPFPEKPVFIQKVVEIGAQLLGFKMPRMVALDGFKPDSLTPAQKLLLRNSILSVNFHVSLDSAATNLVLGGSNRAFCAIDDSVLTRALQYSITKPAQ